MCRSRVTAPVWPGCDHPSSRLHSSYSRRLGGFTVARPSRAGRGAGAPASLRMAWLCASYFRRAPACYCRAACATDGAPGQPPAQHWPGAGRQGRCPPSQRIGTPVSGATLLRLSAGAYLRCPPRRRACLEWTTGPSVAASVTAQFSLTWDVMWSLTCCPTVRRTA